MDISKIHTTNASLKWFIMFIAIISIALLSYPAKAETGSISAQTNNNYAYTVGSAAVATTLNFSYFAFYNTDYNHVINFYIQVNPALPLPFSKSSNSSTFTCIEGATCTGYAYYDNFTHRLVWNFNNDMTITANRFKISYDQGNPFTYDYTGSASTSNLAGNQISAAVPVCLANDGNTACTIIVAAADAYNANFVGVTNTINYNVTYPFPNIYQVFINKYGSAVGSNVTLNNGSSSASGIYFREATFNTNNYTATLNYSQEPLYINHTIVGGYQNVLVNATNATVAPAAPNASNPNAANCVGYNCIFTSKPTYNNTESVNVYGSFYPSTGTKKDCLFFGFVCTDTTINLESNKGWVFIRTQGSTSPIKFMSFIVDQNDNYNLFTDLPIGTYQAQLYGFNAPGQGTIPGQPISLCQGGVVYEYQQLDYGCYYPHNITTFNVVNNSGNLSIVWQTRFSNNTVLYGDTVTVAWSNVTANDTVRIYDENHVLLQSYNINQSTISQLPVFIPLYHIGRFNATIFNGSNILHNATAYLNVVPPGAVDVNNSFGITMYWSKATDVINNPTFLNWNTGTYTGNYNISILKDGTEVRRNSYYGVPGQAQQASYTFGEQGAYIAQFLDFPNQTVQAQADIFISATTTTGGGTGGTTNESGNNLVGSSNLILNIPWIGLMVLIVVIFGLVKNNVQGGNFVFAVAITTSIEAVIGLWEEWGVYITVLSWLLVGMFFKLNKAIEV